MTWFTTTENELKRAVALDASVNEVIPTLAAISVGVPDDEKATLAIRACIKELNRVQAEAQRFAR